MVDESLIDGGYRRRVQRTRVRKDGWTKTRRAAFLKALADTCNVSLSVERAGMSHTGVYDLRRRDGAFAQLWDDALAIGYDRLEALLLQRALEGVNDLDVSAVTAGADEADSSDDATRGEPRGHRHPGSGIARGLARNEVQLALALLNRRGTKDGLRARGRKSMSSEEVDALLTRKLDALARRPPRG